MNPGLIIVVLVAMVGAVGLIRTALRGNSKSSIGSGDPPPLDLQDPLVIELASEFCVLDALPISTEDEQKAWEAARWIFDEKLRTVWSSIYTSLPHELDHYLDDMDIRAKDEGYARRQRNQLAMLLNHPSV